MKADGKMAKVGDQNPRAHRKYLVIRDGRCFTATPCYGLHEPWWVVTTMEGEAEPVPMSPGDEWRPLEDAVAEIRAVRPAAIIQEYTGRFHLFEDAEDARQSGIVGCTGIMSVRDWIWHPRSDRAAAIEPCPTCGAADQRFYRGEIHCLSCGFMWRPARPLSAVAMPGLEPHDIRAALEDEAAGRVRTLDEIRAARAAEPGPPVLPASEATCRAVRWLGEMERRRGDGAGQR